MHRLFFLKDLYKVLFTLLSLFFTEGVRHDAGMLRMSGLLEALDQYSYSSTNQPLCIYGDRGYPMRVHLQVPYQGARLSNDEQSFNASMSIVRTAVEWVFGDIVSYSAFLDLKKNLKEEVHAVCTLLRNAVTSLWFLHKFIL